MPADDRPRCRSVALTGRRGWKHGTVADHPELAAQFDVTANGGRTPEQVNAGTPEKLAWVCSVAHDHTWRASGANRVRGTGCPACSGQQVSVTNSLTRHPDVAAQFDIEANDGLTPDQVLAGTSKRFWWVCPVADDHRWRAPVAERVAGAGCPACIGRKVTPSNSLASYPQLAAQYDVEANGGRPATAVLATTQAKLWWACQEADDHRWQATGLNRVRGGTGCPACAGQQPSTTNNLARHPSVAAQLDVARNGGLTPEEIVATTDERLWWICPVADDHRWQAKGYDRVRNNSGCPACAGRQPSITNSLAARFPELAKQFDVIANGTTPDQVVATTNKLLSWTLSRRARPPLAGPGRRAGRRSGVPGLLWPTGVDHQ